MEKDILTEELKAKLDETIDQLVDCFESQAEADMYMAGIASARGDVKKEQYCIATMAIYRACVQQNIEPRSFLKAFNRQRYDLLVEMEDTSRDY